MNTTPKIANIGAKKLLLLSSSPGWSVDPSGCGWTTGAEKKYQVHGQFRSLKNMMKVKHHETVA